MRTIAGEIYTERYTRLKSVLDCMDRPDMAQAHQLLQALLRDLDAGPLTPEQVQTAFFVTALQKRLSQDFNSVENLYLLPDEGRQIQMFNFMAQKFPVVRYAQELVNQIYLRHLRGQSEITIWDVGIGNGQQMARLLESLLATGQKPETVQIIGLDPSESSLENAQKTLVELCAAHQTEFRFLGLPKTVESLTEADWRSIAPILAGARGRWVANASFSLHHIHPITLRTAFFQRIQAYQPAVFCLIEPYADFLNPDLKQRFENAWHHYGLAFWAIDQIDAPLESRNLLKTVFFGREIIDVITKDTGRIEQFETGEMWAARLREAEFQTDLIQDFPKTIPDFNAINIQAFQDFVGLMAQGHPVISILSAHPSAGL